MTLSRLHWDCRVTFFSITEGTREHTKETSQSTEPAHYVAHHHLSSASPSSTSPSSPPPAPLDQRCFRRTARIPRKPNPHHGHNSRPNVSKKKTLPHTQTTTTSTPANGQMTRHQPTTDTSKTTTLQKSLVTAKIACPSQGNRVHQHTMMTVMIVLTTTPIRHHHRHHQKCGPTNSNARRT